MSHITRKRLSSGVLALALGILSLAGQASAQAPADRPAGDAGAGAGAGGGAGAGAGARPAGDAGMNNNQAARDEGFNPGWLGLLGLAGLAGLMPKKTHTVTTTTHRPGDAPVR